jgi:hypothetical protein
VHDPSAVPELRKKLASSSPGEWRRLKALDEAERDLNYAHSRLREISTTPLFGRHIQDRAMFVEMRRDLLRNLDALRHVLLTEQNLLLESVATDTSQSEAA